MFKTRASRVRFNAKYAFRCQRVTTGTLHGRSRVRFNRARTRDGPANCYKSYNGSQNPSRHNCSRFEFERKTSASLTRCRSVDTNRVPWNSRCCVRLVFISLRRRMVRDGDDGGQRVHILDGRKSEEILYWNDPRTPEINGRISIRSQLRSDLQLLEKQRSYNFKTINFLTRT